MARVKSESESPLTRVRVESQVLQISDSSRTRVESLRLESASLVTGVSRLLSELETVAERVEALALLEIPSKANGIGRGIDPR